MPHDLRAVLFDLDDTLYPIRRYRLSGFAAAAREIDRRYGFQALDVFASLVRAFRGPNRGREIQTCLTSFDLPLSLMAELVDIMRRHPPSLRLPRASRDVLARMRPRWQLGIVTNGDSAVQRRKIRALGLEAFVDTVVYASEHGVRGGKPDPQPFLEAARRLRAEPRHIVFVGDDESVDIEGAADLGMATVRMDAYRCSARVTSADVVVASMLELPAALELLQAGTCEKGEYVA